MHARPLPTAEYLRECFEIDLTCPSGLRWKQRPKEHFKTHKHWKIVSSRDTGKPAGWMGTTKKGVKLWFVGKMLAHRVIYAMVHGDFDSSLEIDHSDRDTTNNSPENLRPANRYQNGSNKGMHKNNTSGFRGVTYDKDRCLWIAQIAHKGKNIRLGRFNTPEEASIARKAASERLHGAFQGLV